MEPAFPLPRPKNNNIITPVKNTQLNELAVCGYESVKAIAAKRPDVVKRLFFTEARAGSFGGLCSILAKSKKIYRIVSPQELEKLSGTPHHQGVVAMIGLDSPKQADDSLVAGWIKSRAKIVVLDKVGDDHNLGSIARSAAFFGWDAMIIGRDDGAAAITTSAYRVARGALEHIPVYSDESAANFLARCSGRLPVFGADPRGKTVLAQADTGSGAFALVLGNEESGLSETVKKLCSCLLKIPGSGKIESLNVSQAAAVLLYGLSEAANRSL